MAANRRINTTGQAALFLAHHFFIEFFTHAVQPLKLKPPRLAGQVNDAGNRMCIVCCELGIKRIARPQQFPHARQVGDIGVLFPREHRVALEPLFLGTFYFRVPVSAFDKTHRDAAPDATGQLFQPAKHPDSPLLVGLQRQTKALPAIQVRVLIDMLKYLQGHRQSCRLFGVDSQPDMSIPSLLSQSRQFRHQCGDSPLSLPKIIARVKRREFH